MTCVNDLINIDELLEEFSDAPADTDKLVQLGASSGVASPPPIPPRQNSIVKIRPAGSDLDTRPAKVINQMRKWELHFEGKNP